MLARRFFFVSLGILALATAYHLGSRSVEAQGTNTVAAGYTITASNMLALTHNGDLWFTQNGGDPGNPNNYPWTFGGNIFTGPGTDVPQSQPGPASESSILEPARPNPFGLATEIAFTLDTEGVTEISVYSPSGQLVRPAGSWTSALARVRTPWRGMVVTTRVDLSPLERTSISFE